MINEVLNHWNSKQIIIHELSGSESEKVNKFLNKRKLDIETIRTAINNYNMILKDEKYWFKYKWTLSEFIGIREGRLEKFLPSGEHYINYIAWKENQPKQKSATEVLKIDIEVETINEEYKKVINKLKSMPYDKYLLTIH
jgi:hypothetical protein